MNWNARSAARIVVGVDGSDASQAALVFALREAAARGATVEVVTAWWLEGPQASAAAGLGEDAHDWAQYTQDRVVGAALDEVPNPTVIARVLVEKDPVPALLGAARGASLLVLGRGRRGVPRTGPVGSISEQCIRRSPCPVAVVPPRGSEDEPEVSLLAQMAGTTRTGVSE